uniref:Trichome birefringence-like C-terminal domain-containing protein n=1 Tax=Nelumbo nucifera TaxID=4432 RepID=A0A822Y1E3_NELNU|nr:TPA_asm: hypothetical protein HUJ06_027271 [Nelumbo nucifera]
MYDRQDTITRSVVGSLSIVSSPGCRFNALDFLVRMRGKTVMFVGDSLGRNQWQSLICMISTAVPRLPTQLVKGHLLSTFKFMEYGVSIVLQSSISGGHRCVGEENSEARGHFW